MNRKFAIFFFATLALTGGGIVSNAKIDNSKSTKWIPETVIPAPAYAEKADGTYNFPAGTVSYRFKYTDTVLEDIDMDTVLEDFVEYLDCKLPFMSYVSGKKADITICLNRFSSRLPDETYIMEIDKSGICISSGSEIGAFYAFQTLTQMTSGWKNRCIPCCKIVDGPRFPYRGLHFDVSRHFRSKEFLMKQMDAMALLKLNRMHLHLTDGAGWRIEIDGYPRLTEYAAWRPQKKWTDWVENGAEYCEYDSIGAYGGYYTADDIKEIVEYARTRHIEVIPEIEMPGHSEEVIRAYPELGCNGASHSGDFCPGKESTFRFLESVLDRVMEMFPSEYVHIGGDEASKGAWKNCPDCRIRMDKEGITDVDGLQSYLIHRIEKYVNSKGRKIIGWDEILQGGLAPNATVMSWRGTEGGIAAARDGHDVIMTPGASCYLDYSQDAPFKEPVSIGGYTSLEKTYTYEPVEEGMTPKEALHILGIQGNLWSEYVTDDNHAEYMYYPRAFAIAETGWSRAENKNYDNFRKRALKLCDLLEEMNFKVFDLKNEYGERKESLSSVCHLGKGCKVTYVTRYKEQYKASGETALTDGIRGGWTYGDQKWQGFLGDMDIIVDLGEITDVKFIGATFMHSYGAWVQVPQEVEFLISENGTDYISAGKTYCDIPDETPKIMFKLYSTICDFKARYIRVSAKKNERPGAWIFTDEIIIN